ncbi:MAG: hypothetical protein FWF36_08985 [Propionibacteriaceae bacterium]|nr:hypothetical protein [Propionibacteriaceae bacterium]
MILRHICEVCGVEETLAEEDAFEKGWDYPPRMGTFGVISPRTCPKCTINQTLWWSLTIDHTAATALTDKQKATLQRILGEPATILASSR